jgi:hypothetical protein
MLFIFDSDLKPYSVIQSRFHQAYTQVIEETAKDSFDALGVLHCKQLCNGRWKA